VSDPNVELQLCLAMEQQANVALRARLAEAMSILEHVYFQGGDVIFRERYKRLTDRGSET
jgi:hypothetical protein